METGKKLNVLIVIYGFPPYMVYGSVIRTIKYIKFLKDKVNFYVLTTPDPKHTKQSIFSNILSGIPVIYVEDSLRGAYHHSLNEISPAPPNTETKSSFYQRTLQNLKRLLVDILIPDRFFSWIRPALKACLTQWGSVPFDIVYSTFPEASAHYLGYRLSRKLKIPLVLDYRDLWTTNWRFKRKFFFINFINRCLEKRIISRASRVIFATPDARELYQREGLASPSQCELLYNGFDPDDIPPPKEDGEPPSGTSPELNIVYTGNIGSVNGSIRNPRCLLDAFATDDIRRLPLHLHFFGIVPPDVEKYIKDRGITDVHLHGRIARKEVFLRLEEADATLVLLGELEDPTEVPGKVYEYLGMKKYVFGLTEENSQLAKLVKEYGYGTVISSTDTDGIIKILREFAAGGKDCRDPNQVDDKFLDRFNRRQQATRLYEIFKETAPRPELKISSPPIKSRR
ncbi:MAG: glycosyltransferase [Candidatus Krumholzibacteriota bacterium]|nr:glycosyltransferase [Candidatus Krumholzibacteriota bacterium]